MKKRKTSSSSREGLNNAAAAMAKQEAERSNNANWEAMLKRWSVDQKTHHRAPSSSNVFDHQILWDGTDPRSAPPQWRGKAKEWFNTREPPKYYYVYDRIYDISCSFTKVDVPESDSEDEDDDWEWMERDRLVDLDELQEYAEFTDIVSVLHSEGSLFSFLCDAFSNKHASVRAKTAEVITTMVHNYPTSQQLLIKEKVLQLLLNNFASDPDETSRTKTLGAISSLIRNNKSGITTFRREKGYAALRKALISGSVCQREVVNLIEYLLHENNLYSQELNLASSDDAEVREAALSGLLLLSRRKCKNSGQLVKNDDELKQVLQEPPAALPIVQSSSSSTFPLLKKKKKKRSSSSSTFPLLKKKKKKRSNSSSFQE